MLNHYHNYEHKNSLFGLLALSIPIEEVDYGDAAVGGNNSSSNDRVVPTWALSVLLILVNDLDITEEQIHAYLPIIVINKDFSAERITFSLRREFAEPFLQQLRLSYEDKLLLLLRTLFRIAMIRLYDGRGRSFFRNLMNLLEVGRDDGLYIEERVSLFFYTHIDKIETMIKAEASEAEKKSQQNAKYLRYAKIGAATLGAGALLAVTGGIAAPALAAAFLTMGATSAAAAVSVTTMATIFGSAGAGLAGYKMMRRTRGLQEFEFQSYGEKNKFAIMIVVSGWIEEDEDEKRAFGILPDKMTEEERLIRFYSLHCPGRLPKVEKELQSFFFHMDDLYNQITELFGKDPRDNSQLIPLCSLDVSEQGTKVVEEFFNEIEQSSSNSGNKKSGASFLSTSRLFGKKKKEEVAPSSSAPPPTTALSSLSIKPDEKEVDDTLDDSSLKEVSEKTEIIKPIYWNWSELPESKVYELCQLRWETNLQKEMGSSIQQLVHSLGTAAVENILAVTVLTAVASAVLFPVFLIQLTSVIDNSWVLAVETADAAGKELAQAILNRSSGTRPVTLVGYSFGARVIYSCLRELAMQCGELTNFDVTEDSFTTEDGKKSAIIDDNAESQKLSESSRSGEDRTNKLTKLEIRSIIQDVVLLGAPVSSKSRAWRAIRSLVSGRLINGYSQKDLVLGLIYRYQRFHYSVCGVCPIEGEPGIENVDLTNIIESHTDYGKKMKEILQFVNLTASV